jgi:hypothetical protein
MIGIYPFQTNPFLPQQQQQKIINYVEGRANVESSYLGPNSSDVYIDTAAKKFYTKHVNASGVATIKEHDYTEPEEPKPPEYVTKAEFEIFKATMKGVDHGQDTDNSDDNR